MAFQSVPNTAEMAFIFSADGNVMQNRINFECITDPYDATLLANLATAGDLWVDSDYLPAVSSDVQYLRTEVRGLNDEFDLVVVEDANAGFGGTVSAVYPLNVSKAFTLRSGLTGRSARGRFYTVGMTAGHTVNGSRTLITTAYRDAFINALTSLISDAFVAGWVMVVTSRYHNGVKRTSGLNFAISQVGVSDMTTDSRRDRLP